MASNNFDLVREYLAGGELEGYDVDELEDNPSFMKEAILASGDKKLYNLCSDRVKKDYDFVNFIITRFSNDVEFIDEVATNYITSLGENIDDDDNFICIVVKMCNLLKKGPHRELYAKYRLWFVARFTYNMIEIAAYFETNPYDERLGKGFCFLQDEYDFNEEVMNLITVEFIREIFKVVGLDRELHSFVKDPQEIQEIGINTFMIRFLNQYDKFLADYSAIHMEVLDELRKDIAILVARWHLYVDREEEYDYETMFTRVHEYYENATDQGVISEELYIYFIGKQLGITEKLAKYQGYTLEEYEADYDADDIEFLRQMLVNMEERNIYANIKRIMESTLFGKEETPNQDGGKIIRVDFGGPGV